MPRVVSIGDVIEIPTKIGFAYAQYSQQNKLLGSMVRVLPGTHTTRPTNFSMLVGQKEVNCVFIPLIEIVRQQIFKVVAKEEIPAFAKPFPIFRAAGVRDTQGRAMKWFLWDGAQTTPIEILSRAHLQLPIRSIWNDTLLIQSIEEGWTPETDPAGK